VAQVLVDLEGRLHGIGVMRVKRVQSWPTTLAAHIYPWGHVFTVTVCFAVGGVGGIRVA